MQLLPERQMIWSPLFFPIQLCFWCALESCIYYNWILLIRSLLLHIPFPDKLFSEKLTSYRKVFKLMTMPILFICLFKDPHSCICINQEGYERERKRNLQIDDTTSSGVIKARSWHFPVLLSQNLPLWVSLSRFPSCSLIVGDITWYSQTCIASQTGHASLQEWSLEIHERSVLQQAEV